MAQSYDSFLESDADIVRNILEKAICEDQYKKWLEVKQNKSYISVKAGNNLVCTVKFGKKVSYIAIPTEQEAYFAGASFTRVSSGQSRISISAISDVETYAKPISYVFAEELAKIGAESFGCCHRYVECSDKMECTHPDVLRSRSCLYRKNLEAGRIFYGANRNT